VQVVIIAVAVAIMAGLCTWYTGHGSGAPCCHGGKPVHRRTDGVNINAIISITFIIGSALAAVAGVMVAANYSIAHLLHWDSSWA